MIDLYPQQLREAAEVCGGMGLIISNPCAWATAAPELSAKLP